MSVPVSPSKTIDMSHVKTCKLDIIGGKWRGRDWREVREKWRTSEGRGNCNEMGIKEKGEPEKGEGIGGKKGREQRGLDRKEENVEEKEGTTY